MCCKALRPVLVPPTGSIVMGIPVATGNPDSPTNFLNQRFSRQGGSCFAMVRSQRPTFNPSLPNYGFTAMVMPARRNRSARTSPVRLRE